MTASSLFLPVAKEQTHSPHPLLTIVNEHLARVLVDFFRWHPFSLGLLQSVPNVASDHTESFNGLVKKMNNEFKRMAL